MERFLALDLSPFFIRLDFLCLDLSESLEEDADDVVDDDDDELLLLLLLLLLDEDEDDDELSLSDELDELEVNENTTIFRNTLNDNSNIKSNQYTTFSCAFVLIVFLGLIKKEWKKWVLINL